MLSLTPEAVSARILNLNTLGRAPIDVKAHAIGEAEFLVLASGKLEPTSPARLDLSAKFQALTEVLADYEQKDRKDVLYEFADGLRVLNGESSSFTYVRQIRDELLQVQRGGMMGRLSISAAEYFQKRGRFYYNEQITGFTTGAEVLAFAVADLFSFTGRERLNFGHKIVKAYAEERPETSILRTRHVIGAVANRLQAQASVA